MTFCGGNSVHRPSKDTPASSLSLGLTRALYMLNHAFRWTLSVGDECHVSQYILLLAHNWCREELLHGLGCPTLSCICVEDIDAVPESAHHTEKGDMSVCKHF